MRPFLFYFLLIFCAANSFAQDGKIFIEHFKAPSLTNNHGGENPDRKISIYLPPGYEGAKRRYPVIYYLDDYTQTDSSTVAYLMNKAIRSGVIRPTIVVIPDS